MRDEAARAVFRAPFGKRSEQADPIALLTGLPTDSDDSRDLHDCLLCDGGPLYVQTPQRRQTNMKP
jgi:hypothetical protein